MDLKSLLNNPKQRMIVLISLLILVGLVGGYYVITNYLLPPSEEVVVSTPKPKTTTETYTLAQILESFTQQTEVVFTYSSVSLGRSNPFLPVIDLTPKKVISSSPFVEKSNVNVTVIPKSTSDQVKNWYSNFRLTGIIRSKDKSYAIIEEGDRGYIVKEGEIMRDSIYLSKIAENFVVLKRGTDSATLKLGGE